MVGTERKLIEVSIASIVEFIFEYGSTLLVTYCMAWCFNLVWTMKAATGIYCGLHLIKLIFGGMIVRARVIS